MRAGPWGMRRTGRHRASRNGVPLFIVFGTVVAVLWAAIWAVFAFQGQPQAVAPVRYVPSSAPSLPAASVPAPVRVYPAASGNSLWGIALRQCGNADDWRNLAGSNHISWPWTVRIGQVITLDCTG